MEKPLYTNQNGTKFYSEGSTLHWCTYHFNTKKVTYNSASFYTLSKFIEHGVADDEKEYDKNGVLIRYTICICASPAEAMVTMAKYLETL